MFSRTAPARFYASDCYVDVSDEFRSLRITKSVGPVDLNDLIWRAAELGIVCSAETVESLGMALSGAETPYLNQGSRNLMVDGGDRAIRQGKSDTAAARTALRPVNFSFSVQAKIAADLHALWIKNRKSYSINKRYLLFLELKIFRLKTAYNVVIADNEKMYSLLHFEIEDLLENNAVKSTKHHLQAEIEEGAIERERLRKEIILASNNPEKQRSLKDQLGSKCLHHHNRLLQMDREFGETLDTQDKVAIDDVYGKMAAMDEASCAKLKEIQATIEDYEKFLPNVEELIAHYEKERDLSLKDMRFARMLATLRGPVRFFQWPREIRDMIYKELLPSNKTILITTCVQHDEPGDGFFQPMTYRLVTHEIFSISQQFRREAASFYYSQNTITSRNILHLELELGLKAMHGQFKHHITRLDLVWASLGKSTVKAVKIINSLRGLKTLNVYISWAQVLGFNRNSRTGIQLFKHLLAHHHDPVKGKSVNVYRVALSQDERVIIDSANRDPNTPRHGRLLEHVWPGNSFDDDTFQSIPPSTTARQEELLFSMILTRRCIPALENCEVYNWYRDLPGSEKTLMTEAELEQRLEEVTFWVEEKEKAEANRIAHVQSQRTRRALVRSMH